jgi:hypothetical protein
MRRPTLSTHTQYVRARLVFLDTAP